MHGHRQSLALSFCSTLLIVSAVICCWQYHAGTARAGVCPHSANIRATRIGITLTCQDWATWQAVCCKSSTLKATAALRTKQRMPGGRLQQHIGDWRPQLRQAQQQAVHGSAVQRHLARPAAQQRPCSCKSDAADQRATGDSGFCPSMAVHNAVLVLNVEPSTNEAPWTQTLDAKSYSCPHYHWTGSVACHVPYRLEVEACELREHAPTSLTSVSAVSAPPALQPKASCMARDTASLGIRYVRAQRAAAQAAASSSLQHWHQAVSKVIQADEGSAAC